MSKKTTETSQRFFYPMMKERTTTIKLNKKIRLRLYFYLLTGEKIPSTDDDVDILYETYTAAKEDAIKRNISQTKIRVAYALLNTNNHTPKGAEELYFKFEDAIAFAEK